jgi:hypothetical protein
LLHVTRITRRVRGSSVEHAPTLANLASNARRVFSFERRPLVTFSARNRN